MSVASHYEQGNHFTNLIKHLVTLVEHESGDTSQSKLLLTHESVQATRSRDNDVWVCRLVAEQLLVLLDVSATVKDLGLDFRHVLAKPLVFILDLERELTRVAHDQNADFAIDWLNLLKSGQHKNGCFSETGLSLAEHIGSKNSLRNAHLLDCRVMLEGFAQSSFRANASVSRVEQSVHPSQRLIATTLQREKRRLAKAIRIAVLQPTHQSLQCL